MSNSSLLKALNREDYLSQHNTAGFTAWLAAKLPTLPVHLKLRRSQFVPQAIDVRLTGIEQVRDHYQWKGTWPVVQRQLSTLRADLQAAVSSGDDDTAYLASVAILDWGNVPKSASFLDTLRRDRKLVPYLTTRARLLSPVGTQHLTELTKAVFFKFNSGLTKVHALLDGHGSPIYDGRVGAAIAMLYHLYRQSDRAVGHADHQVFAWGPGMEVQGATVIRQIRNPRLLGYAGTPQLLGHQSPHLWARRQLILSWIIREVLLNSRLFMADQTDLAGRCHAFEAGLFMLGYDLRALVPGGWAVPDPVKKSKG
ncbi:hypothetical protein ACWAUP_004773 [Pseudomonas aeruginosa]